MHLSSLVLKGFKSFASTTTLRLEPGITCVVGPNGSGKSNVVDALAWVMGEQGAKTLRGGSMQDVIFAGTAATPGRAGRPPLGRAEVALTIDNSDGALPIAFAEVTISRTVFRTGGSEYAINGAPARLLDVQELLADSGIGREMHVIVGQGQLDAVLHATPEDRRGFVEEAAGVLKHRRRKERALRKLESTATNLTRLTDLAAEVRRQLGPLGRQAEVARRALTVQADVRDARGRLLADDLVQAEAALAADVAGEAATARARAETEVALAAARDAAGRAEAGVGAAAARAAVAGEAAAALGALRERAAGTAGLAAERLRGLDERARAAEAAARGDGARDPGELRTQARRWREQEAALTASVARAGEALATAGRERGAAEQALAAHERAVALARRAAADRREHLGRLGAQVASRRSRWEGAEAEARRASDALAGAGERVSLARVAVESLTASQGGTSATAPGGAPAPGTAGGPHPRPPAEVEGRPDPVTPHGSPVDAEALAACEERLAAAEVELAAARRAERDAERDRAGAAARCEALELGLRERRDGARSLLDHGGHLPGTSGALADHLVVVPGAEDVVAAALAQLADAVVVDSVGSAVDALRWLTDHDGGRAELLVAPGPIAPDPDGVAPDGVAPAAPDPFPARDLPSGVRRLVDLVEPGPGAPSGLAAALHRLLAGACAVDGLAAAVALVAADPRLTAVTAAGEVLGADAASGGGTSGAPTLVHVRAALELATAALRSADAAGEAARHRLAAAADAQGAARETVAAARAAVRARDAAEAARARRTGELTGVLRAAEHEHARLQQGLVRTEQALDAARTALAGAEEALAAATADEPDPAGSDAVVAAAEGPDEARRTALADAATAARAAEVEARLALRTGEERLRPLAGRAEGLERSADAEERTRARAAEQVAGLRGRARVAGEVEAAAGELLDLVVARSALAGALRTAAAEQHDRAAEELAAARTASEALTARLTALTESDHREQVARARLTAALDALRARARNDLGTDPDVLVEELGPHLPIPAGAPSAAVSTADDGPDGVAAGAPYVRAEQEARLRRAERDLARLGAVNPLALEEFAALEERSTFLTDQLEDLRRTRADLLDLVREVDARVEQVFAAAYADTAAAFETVFARLFPGGEGRLVLTDPDDMLTTGIEVEARPAGKRVRRLSLLSGGERSLAAIALLVAIFTARPSPFYVLDEVEAALDDTNLRRLLGVLEELRATSQLIVVTHQERTMEIADALYGVTMRGDGVTAVVSQRLRRPAAATPVEHEVDLTDAAADRGADPTVVRL